MDPQRALRRPWGSSSFPGTSEDGPGPPLRGSAGPGQWKQRVPEEGAAWTSVTPPSRRCTVRPSASGWSRTSSRAPAASTRPRTASPTDITAGMAEMGMFGVTIPEEYGGMPLPDEERLIYAMITIHEIARADLSMSTPVYTLLTIGWAYIVNRYGTEELKQEVLPAVAAGKAFAGINTTEPGGGSDLSAIKTIAPWDEEKQAYILNGEKAYVSRSQGVREVGRPERPLHARQDRPEPGPQGHDLHLGPRPPGRHHLHHLQGHGPHGPQHRRLDLQGRRAAQEVRAGRRGQGLLRQHGRLQRRPRARLRGLPRRRREGARDQRRVHRPAHHVRQAARQERGHLLRDGRRLDAARHAQAQPAARRLDDRPGAHQPRPVRPQGHQQGHQHLQVPCRRRSATTSPATG